MRYPPFIENDCFQFPRLFKVRINYSHHKVLNLSRLLNEIVDNILPISKFKSGDTVAIGVGSRAINDIANVVKIVCHKLIDIGAKPFIIPAMGSHGGATDRGQIEILKSLGITDNACGAPIVSTLEVVKIGYVYQDIPIYYSKDAINADHSICINRIKPHTKFKADIESGILKMLCIGMGKHQGAITYHKWALKYGFYNLLKEIGEVILNKTNFRFGIAIIENAYHETMCVEAILNDRVIEREAELLKVAKENFAKLPFSHADVLIVHSFGKDISGTGMDPNVTGRTFDLGEDDFSKVFQATRVAVLNLSEKSKGNAIGIGNADIITERVYQQIDYETMLMNALTGMSLRKAFIPIRLPNDLKAIQACFTTIGPISPLEVRVIMIKNTLDVAEFWVSEALLDEVKDLPEAEIIGQSSISFNKDGNIILPVC